MPTYEYACRECGQHVEVVQSFRDDPLTICPNCRGMLRKVYGAAGIIFKGSGYYVNDSRKSAAKGADGAGKKADAKEGATASSGGDSGGSVSGGGESSNGGSGGGEPKGGGGSRGGESSNGGSAKPAASASPSETPRAKSA